MATFKELNKSFEYFDFTGYEYEPHLFDREKNGQAFEQIYDANFFFSEWTWNWWAYDFSDHMNWDLDEKSDNSLVEYQEASNTYLISVGLAAATLNELLANADAGATFILENGVHEFTEALLINRDDITFKGESEEETVLNFTFPAGTGGNFIEVTGGGKNKETLLTVSAAAEAGANTISVADASGLTPGEVIYISQPNTEEYLLANGWDNVSMNDAASRPFREFITRVEAVNGNILTLSSPLPFDFEAGVTTIAEMNMLENVVLKDFTITSGLEAEPNYYDFVNTYPEFENTSAVYVENADRLELSNISVLDAPSSGFDFRSTLELSADALYVNGAHNLGGGGNGYGINLYDTFDATIENAEIFNVRHALLFSSWNAEVGNQVEISATNRDINFHGSPDVDNQVVVRTSILDYDPSQNTGPTNGFWDIVSAGGSRHANTDFFKSNSVVFTHAEGSFGSETIHGADGGAYLDGKESQDVIIGGSGDDVIIGGTSRDTLTGGDGADLFVFRLGDAYDTVTDFSGDGDGDQILISGNTNLLTFDDLQVTQKESDAWIRYGANSTIILEEYDSAKLEADYFLFDPLDEYIEQLNQDYLLLA